MRLIVGAVPLAFVLPAAAVFAQDIAVTKSGQAEVTAGERFAYTVTVTNNHPLVQAFSVVMTDTLPPEVSLVSVSPSATCSGTTTITCNEAILFPGVPVTYTITVDVDGTAAPGTEITNNASVTQLRNVESPPDPIGNNAAQAQAVVVAPDMAIQKSHNGNGVRGQNVTYSIVATNVGGAPTTGPTVVTDTLPAGLSLVSISGGVGWNCSGVPAISCTFAGVIGAGSSPPAITVIAGVDANAPASVTNFVRVSTQGDADQNNDTDLDLTTIDSSADLSVTKTGPAALTAGAAITYTINVANVGPSPATSVSLTDALPAGVTFSSLTEPAGWNCTTPAVNTNGTITCTLATLPAGGAPQSFTVTGQVDVAAATGNITNTATVGAASPDPNAANNSDSATTAITALVIDADLSVTKTALPAATVPGGLITYTITVANAGPADATAVVLDDPLAVGQMFRSIATPPGWTCTTPAVGSNGNVNCTRPLFPSGAAASEFTIVAEVPSFAVGSVGNTAIVTSGSNDPDTANNTASTTVPVTALSADLSITKTAEPTVNVGDDLTYTIDIANAGPTGATALVLSDALPTGITFVSLTFPAGWTCTTPSVGANGTVTCNLAALASGATSGPLLLTGTVTPAATGTTTNTATIAAAEADAAPGNNSASFSTDVLGAPPPTSLSLTLGFSTPTYIAEGEVIGVSYLVTNTSAVTVNTIVVTDPKVPVITCPQTSLAAAAATTCTGPYTITAADMTAGTSAFTATVTGSGGATATATGVISSITIQNDDFVRTRGQLLQIDPPGLHDRIGQVTAGLTESSGDPTLNFAASFLGGASTAANDLASGAVVPPFKVWIDGKLTLHTRANGGGGFGQLGLGSDYLINENLLLGAALYIDWMTDMKTARTTTGVGYLTGPYVSAEIGEHLTFDGGIFLGGSTNDVAVTVAGRTFRGTLNTERIVVQAQIDGLWNLEMLTIRPDVTLFLRHETVGDYTVRDAAGAVVPVTGFTNTSLNLSGGATFDKAVPLEHLVFIPQVGLRLGVTGRDDALALDNPYGSVSTGFMLQGDAWQYQSTVELSLWASSLKAATWKGTLSGEF